MIPDRQGDHHGTEERTGRDRAFTSRRVRVRKVNVLETGLNRFGASLGHLKITFFIIKVLNSVLMRKLLNSGMRF